MIEWDKPDERYFTTGTDHGVLYPKNGKPAVPWNGIIGVTESGAGDTSVLYRDGIIYHTDVEPGDYSGTLSAYFWPDEFNECMGMPEVAPGLIADYQPPQHFDLTYRSLVGSGERGDMFGYQIHLIYNAIASANSRTRKTLTQTPSMDEYGFDLVATPVHVPGLRPTAHFILDSRGMDRDALSGLEYTLYQFGQMPDPSYVYDLLKYSGVMFTYVLRENGSVLISGPGKHYPGQGYGMELDSVTGKLSLFNAVAVNNGNGSYTFSDGPS